MNGFDMSRDERLQEEALSLWQAMSSEPPPRGLKGESLLKAAMGLQPPPAYDRIYSPHLRESQITRPR